VLQNSVVTGQEASNDSDTLLSSIFHDSARVVLIIERLISEIERTGLYTVGIYRKPGPAVKIKHLIKLINSSSGNLNIHVAMLSCVFTVLIELFYLQPTHLCLKIITAFSVYLTNDTFTG